MRGVTPLHRTIGTAAAALLSALALAGCAPGATTPAPAVSGGGSAQTSEAPGPASSTGTAEPVQLPWPARTASDAAALQAAADSGSQPWLLDPSEVAVSYAAAAHGWADAEGYPGPDGTSVDVRNSDGERLTLSLVQPARVGDDGIWVVTAEHPA